jgi:protocatechuate 3,4-dioxygenase beta subunit
MVMHSSFHSSISLRMARRDWLRRVALVGGGALVVPSVFAELLTETPEQTEGPFYPDRLPLDTDNDLIRVNAATTPAIGEVTLLSGRILDKHGAPVRGATVEIWQCDANGAYLHSRSGNGSKRDPGFQGFGRFLTGSSGEYLFRTIKPVSYPGRTPHIHVKVYKGTRELLTTQCYIKGFPANERDGVLKGLADPASRALLMAEFIPLASSKTAEFAAKFDIVLGATPPDA